MKIKSMKMKNFRSYKEEIAIEFGNLTTFVGKNDIGKSSILEALDVFFNEGNGVIKFDKDDVNKQAVLDGENDIIISVCFEELPNKIIIDATNETTLQAEYLLNSHNQLEIIKKYSNGGKEKVFVKANHPTNKQCNDLLQKKDSDLREIIKKLGIDCNEKNKNAAMRTTIWNHYKTDLQLAEIEIDITKGDVKSIWEKLQGYLPLYSLFQSDRKNSDGDNEIQDPLKEAVKQILNDDKLRQKFNEIASEVEMKLKEVSHRTLEKIREMNPDVANSLNPVIPSADKLKWADVFKSVTISGDEEIPINKRGSGIKRLVLLNFFRAEAERKKEENKIPNVIYGIEEPETSQHTEHQKMLIKAFKEITANGGTQIIITTHSATLVKELNLENLRLISIKNSTRIIEMVEPNKLPYTSLNEVNFLAFSEVTDEYHNELYGYIEEKKYMADFKKNKPTMSYIQEYSSGNTENKNVILTEYIRHQIHHPENKQNNRFTFEQLQDSINQMREFLQSKISSEQKT